MTELIDMHCHLAEPDLAADIDGVVERARSAGVRMMLCCGTGPTDWAAVERLAGIYPEVTAAYGVHPWYVTGVDAAGVERLLRDFLSQDGAAWVGEIGLDNARVELDARQRDIFRLQLNLAAEYGRGVSVHCVRAWGALVDELQSLHRMPRAVVLHGYSGSAEMVTQLARLGCMFSFSVAVARGNRKLAAAVSAVPDELLLVESDAPFASAEPSALVQAVEAVATLRGTTAEVVAGLVTSNARQLLFAG